MVTQQAASNSLVKWEESPQLFLADADGAAMTTGVRDNQCWVDTGNHDVTEVLRDATRLRSLII